eukprot:5544703-Pyramimonas_sp.AAC.1
MQRIGSSTALFVLRERGRSLKLPREARSEPRVVHSARSTVAASAKRRRPRITAVIGTCIALTRLS